MFMYFVHFSIWMFIFQVSIYKCSLYTKKNVDPLFCYIYFQVYVYFPTSNSFISCSSRMKDMFTLQVETASHFISFGLYFLIHKSLMTVLCFILFPLLIPATTHFGLVALWIECWRHSVHIIAVDLFPALLKGGRWSLRFPPVAQGSGVNLFLYTSPLPCLPCCDTS